MVAVWAVWLQVTIVYEGSVVKIREQKGEKWKKKEKKKILLFVRNIQVGPSNPHSKSLPPTCL